MTGDVLELLKDESWIIDSIWKILSITWIVFWAIWGLLKLISKINKSSKVRNTKIKQYKNRLQQSLEYIEKRGKEMWENNTLFYMIRATKSAKNTDSDRSFLEILKELSTLWYQSSKIDKILNIYISIKSSFNSLLIPYHFRLEDRRPDSENFKILNQLEAEILDIIK